MRKTKSAVHITTLPHRIRIVVIFLLVILAFISVLCRLYHLQCLNHEKYVQEAERQHYKEVELPAKRGAIFDRNGTELAVSIDVFDVVCSPNAIAQVKNSKAQRKRNIDGKLAKALAPILNQSEKSLLTTFTSDTKAKRVVIAKGIDGIDLAQVNAVLTKYWVRNEVVVEPVSKRFYPKAELACHVLGPVGIGSGDTTYTRRQENWGLYGIEQKQQKNISGSFTKTVRLQDYSGRNLTPLDYASLLGVEGNRLYLTIDETIQHAAERVLEEAVEKNKAAGGCMIVMDPFTGEILALANVPNFDLNRYREIARNQAVWRKVSRNEAVEGVIEPGSTAKIFTAAAALEEKAVTLTDKFYGYKGKVVFCNRVLRDSHPYEWLTFPEVIEISSNIGIHQVAQKMSPARLRDYFVEFGFGSRSGIELPGEAYGLVPGLKQWTPLTMSRISFGQSISMSPLQLTCAVAVIANGGMLMKPHIVKAVYDAQGRKIKELRPEPVRRVISDLTAKTMAAIMEGVVERGTGKMAKMELYRVAGKTGTAQIVLENARGYKPGKYNSSFVGFVPAEAPRVVITVIINEPSAGFYYGGTVAAPVFKAVAEEALTQLGVHPSLPPAPNAYEVRDWIPASAGMTSAPLPTVIPAKSGTGVRMVTYAGGSSAEGWKPAPLLMPDVRGLTKRKIAYLLSPYKMGMRFVGSGVAVEQSPAPGEEIKFGTICVIRFTANWKN
ncbi:MAG: penicillin-binding protein [bacterium]|nr:penicillin-binding protein [bacterium]